MGNIDSDGPTGPVRHLNAPWPSAPGAVFAGVRKAMAKVSFPKIWSGQAGFSLIEVVVATTILGTVAVASTSLIAQAANTSGEREDASRLLQLAQSQVEAIRQSSFQSDPSRYPAVIDVPGGFTVVSVSADPDTESIVTTLDAEDAEAGLLVKLAVRDSGITYSYPQPDGTVLTNIVQMITVTIKAPSGDTALTFYKLESP